MSKYYAVRVGHKVGVYSTWDEASKLVLGYPGAEYKKFNNKEDAEAFVQGNQTPVKNKTKPLVLDKDTASAYTDGSYRTEDGSVSYGLAVTYQGYRYEESLRYYKHPYKKYRNVMGELYGGIKAIQIALQLGAKRVLVHHDYEGVGAWADKKWKAKTELAQSYQKQVEKLREKIDVEFIKVEAHSGIPMNELADYLATEAKDTLYRNKVSLEELNWKA